MAIETGTETSSQRATGLWVPTSIIHEKIIEASNSRLAMGIKDWLAWNIIHNTVHLNRSNKTGEVIKEELAKGNMPCGISSHEGHGDGIAFALDTEDMLYLWAQVKDDFPDCFPLQGSIAPMARSWKTGHQGDHLKNSYELLKPTAERMGLFTMPHTRPKDIRKYRLSREFIKQEKDEFEGWVNAGYMPLILPAASVQGGRHREGSDMEDIYGMPLITNNVIRDCFQMTDEAAGRITKGEAFFHLLALHGSFRYVLTEQEKEPKLTGRGITSLALAALYLPTVLPKIEATVMVVTKKEAIADLGPGGLRDSMALNDYIMKKIAAVLPPHARGAYA